MHPETAEKIHGIGSNNLGHLDVRNRGWCKRQIFARDRQTEFSAVEDYRGHWDMCCYRTGSKMFLLRSSVRRKFPLCWNTGPGRNPTTAAPKCRVLSKLTQHQPPRPSNAFDVPDDRTSSTVATAPRLPYEILCPPLPPMSASTRLC